jgi:hypothetical protein
MKRKDILIPATDGDQLWLAGKQLRMINNKTGRLFAIDLKGDAAARIRRAFGRDKMPAAIVRLQKAWNAYMHGLMERADLRDAILDTLRWAERRFEKARG